MKKYKWTKKTIGLLIVSLILIVVGFYASIREVEGATEADCLLKVEEATREAALSFREELDESLKDFTSFARITVRSDMSDALLQTLLAEFCEENIFCGIQLFREGSEVLNVGDLPVNAVQQIDFNEELARVPYYSGVVSDGDLRAERYIYEAIPLYTDDQLTAVAYGYIRLDALPVYLTSGLFEGKLRLFLVDGATGTFMIDEYHRYDADGSEQPLMSVSELWSRDTVGGYNWETLNQNQLEGKSGYMEFVSGSNGQIYYASYTPLGINNWSVMLILSRTTAFATFNVVRRVMMIMVGIMMLAGLLCVGAIVVQDRENRKQYEKIAREADAANRAKSEFLSRMIHDIRTPMNAIIGYTDLAMKHAEDPQRVQDCFEKISVSSHHLLALINDILEMSRIESGKVILAEDQEHLPDILHSLRTIFHAEISAKSIEFYMDASDVKNEDVYCDKLRLNQVLINLLSNAVKFTKPGGKVGLRIIQVDDAAPGYAHYEFHVIDTGIGISKEAAKHIFEPFERGNTAAVGKIQGSGLGLSIAKNLVELMGGTIALESEQGKGSEFVVHLTFRVAAAAEMLQDRMPQLEGANALVVDDDANTCFSVCKMLEDIGMHAEWTTSGKEAVLRTKYAIERKSTFSVFIVDLLIPDMNGIEVVRRIRREIGDEIPIVILTAYDWSDIEAEARAAGVTAFCAKPLFMSELLAALHRSQGVRYEQLPVSAAPKALRFDGKRVLLAEDNVMNAEIARTILQESGFAVEVVPDGQQAVQTIECASAGWFDLVLMDVQMPVMNGLEATRRIRQLEDPQKRAIKILAMTANAFEEDVRACKDAGMLDHIPKPFDREKMLAVLAKYVGVSEAKAAPAAEAPAGVEASAESRLQRFYQLVNGSYDAMIKRLQKPERVEKLLALFAEDDSMQQLKIAAAEGNAHAAFAAVHTLKGVSGNLGLDALYQAASNLTEQLRPQTEPMDEALYQAVLRAYENTLKALKTCEILPKA